MQDNIVTVGLPDAAVKESRDLRSMLAVSGEQLDRPVLHDWIERRGLQAEWKLVSGWLDSSSLLPPDPANTALPLRPLWPAIRRC